MEYKFFQSKKVDSTKNDLEWINKNLGEISKSENVLCTYQTEYETILLTDKHIYFPNERMLRKLSFNEVHKIKISSDVVIEILTHDKCVHSITLATIVSKVKLHEILGLIKNNYYNNISTEFEDIKQIFDKFSIIRDPTKQDQHIISQVYLKQFGYQHNKQWLVTVIKKGEKFTREKSIGSFTAVTNVFDINSEDDRIVRLFEKLNWELENVYINILDDIESNSFISEKSHSLLLQIVPNLMVRTDFWRDFVKEMLNSESKMDFLKITLAHLVTRQVHQKLEQEDFFNIIAQGEIDNDKVNRTLLFLLSYIFDRIQQFDIIILEAPQGQKWITSDNPVIVKGNEQNGDIGICGIDSEFYFPLSAKYLAYLHCRYSKLKVPFFRKLENRKKYQIHEIMTKKEYNTLIKEIILDNPSKFVILPFKVKHKIK